MDCGNERRASRPRAPEDAGFHAVARMKSGFGAAPAYRAGKRG